MTDPLAPVLSRIDADLPQALDRLSDLLRIPSISTDPAHKPDVEAAADWLVKDLTAMGFSTRKDPTTGHPMVVATGGAEDGPHLLFYGHYDVQPVDPLHLWDHDPFDAQVQDTPRGKVIRARGASDDKGQLMTFLEACRAWLAEHGSLPVKLTFFLEGEEESGSPSLVPYMTQNAEKLKADVALICDTGMYDAETPAITTMLRGLLGEEITIHAADRDLHSGMFGGAAMNPARVLARILSDLHDDQGRVTVPGFYDDVPDLPADIRAQWAELGFDAEAFLGQVGLRLPAGEQDRSALEMIWARPTCEINGMISGYTGAGFKTVLPAQASAKVSFRLVGQQDPHKLRESFREFVQARVPADCRVQFAEHGASPASVMSTDHPAFEAARQALSAEWPKPAAFVGSGGSIPIAGYFKSILGMDSMLIGFAKEDDAIHSPNEKYDLDSFHRGTRSWARIIDAISKA